MTDHPFDELRGEVSGIPPASDGTRERIWSAAIEPLAPSRHKRRRWRAKLLLPIAAAYLIAVPIATAVVVGHSDTPARSTFGVAARFASPGAWHWQTIGANCPRPSKDVPLRACMGFARTAGTSALYLNGIVPDGASRITIRFADGTTENARTSGRAFLLAIPVNEQAQASDARVRVVQEGGIQSRSLALADLMGDPGFGYRVEHDYRRNNPCRAKP
jgi:hypothetical protein